MVRLDAGGDVVSQVPANGIVVGLSCSERVEDQPVLAGHEHDRPSVHRVVGGAGHLAEQQVRAVDGVAVEETGAQLWALRLATAVGLLVETVDVTVLCAAVPLNQCRQLGVPSA